MKIINKKNPKSTGIISSAATKNTQMFHLAMECFINNLDEKHFKRLI